MKTPQQIASQVVEDNAVGVTEFQRKVLEAWLVLGIEADRALDDTENSPVTEAEWVIEHKLRDDEYLEDRPIIVNWRDQAETPSQCISRLNGEVIACAEELAESEARVKKLEFLISSHAQAFEEFLKRLKRSGEV